VADGIRLHHPERNNHPGWSGRSPGGKCRKRATVTLDHLLLQNGRADGGAGIWNQGTLTLSYSQVTNSVTNDNSSGGGISNPAGASIHISWSTISGNICDGATTSGGGIYNSGALFIENSAVTGNKCHNTGGIYNQGSATLVNVTVSSNTVNYQAPSAYRLPGLPAGSAPLWPDFFRYL